MVNYRYLGYGITNEQGIATLDHDANGDPITHSYTGTGAGKVDIVASTDKPVDISDSSLQSEIYEVLDATFKDMGTDSDYGTWSNWTGYEADITRNSEYTSMKIATGKTDARRYKSISLTDFCIEFDVLLKSNSVEDVFATIRNVWSVLGNMSLNRFNLSLNNWHHIKMTCNENTVVVTNDTNSTSYTYSLSNTFERFLFQIGSNSQELQYKNFVIYPI